MRVVAHIPVLLLLVGCASGRVDGTIGGDRVPALDGFFYQEAGVGAGGTSAVHVHLWSEAGACERVAAFIEAQAEVPDWSDLTEADLTLLAEAAEDELPGDYWEMLISFFVPDLSADLGGTYYAGLEELASSSPELLAHATHHHQRYDAGFWDGSADREAYFTSWVNRGGGLDVARHRPGEKLVGELTTSWIRNGSAEVEGETTVGFTVRRCTEVEDAYALFESR